MQTWEKTNNVSEPDFMTKTCPHFPRVIVKKYKPYKLIFIQVLWIRLIFLDPESVSSLYLVTFWIYLSKYLWRDVLVWNIHISPQIGPRTRFAGSHLFSYYYAMSVPKGEYYPVSYNWCHNIMIIHVPW